MDTIEVVELVAVVVTTVVGVVWAIAKRIRKRRKAAAEAAKYLPPPQPGELDGLQEARPGITAALFVKLFTPAIIAALLVLAYASATGAHGIGVFFVTLMVSMAVFGVTAIVLPKPRHDMCPSCYTSRSYDRHDVGLRMTCRKCGRQWQAGTCPGGR